MREALVHQTAERLDLSVPIPPHIEDTPGMRHAPWRIGTAGGQVEGAVAEMQSRERQRTAAVQGGLGEWGDRQRQPSDGRPGDDLRRRNGQQRRQGGQAAAEFGAHQRHGFGRNRRRGE